MCMFPKAPPPLPSSYWGPFSSLSSLSSYPLCIFLAFRLACSFLLSRARQVH